MYQAFEKPLPRGHGSVGLVRYRTVTARERFFKGQQNVSLCLSGSELADK